MTDLRRYLTLAAALLGVLLAVTAAFAAADLDVASEHRNERAEKADSEPEDGEQASREAKLPNGEGEDNHGQCVSAAAHHEAEGLEGWRKGLFLSSVAQDESLVGEDCDFSSHLSDALSAPEKGGGGPESSEAGGASTSSEAQDGGKEFGQSKRAENAPDGD